jgi:hypothetical protein
VFGTDNCCCFSLSDDVSLLTGATTTDSGCRRYEELPYGDGSLLS